MKKANKKDKSQISTNIAKNDPLGSYTGTCNKELGIAPVQDADDL